MSRGRTARVFVLALASAAAPVALARAQNAPERPPASSKPTDDQVAAVARVVGELRERGFKDHVPAKTMRCSTAAVRLMEIARAEGARCSADIELAVRALGFVEGALPVPEGGELSEEPSGPCGLAFYDQLKKEIVVVEGRSSTEERGEVLAHELSHALQDQLFDLRARLRILPRTPSGDHDAEELATNAALNEGEATVLELLYVWRTGGDRSSIQGVIMEDPLEHAAELLGVPFPAAKTRAKRLETGLHAIRAGTRQAWALQRRLGASCYLPTLARFQYLAGAAFVAEAWHRGGWTTVDQLRASPPSSTEQLLHPEKYFDEPDVPVMLDSSPILAESGGRYRLLYDNRLGELGASLVTESDASGWGGDRYRVLERKDGSCLVESRSVWDDEESARRFSLAAQRWVRSMRLREGGYDVVERRGRAVVILAGLEKDEAGDLALAAFRDGAEGRLAEAATGDRVIALRKRAADGTTQGEARLVERRPAAALVAEHLDASREGSIETDGSSYGFRSRSGGGVTLVLVSGEGPVIVAGAKDRAAAKDVAGTLERITSEPVRKGEKPSKAVGKINVR